LPPGDLGALLLEDSGQPNGRLLVAASTSTDFVGAAEDRPSQPPRSRLRKSGRSAGAEAVMRARLVSIAETTKPMLNVGSEEVTRPKRPCTKRTSRTTEVMVTLKRY
jgi:hypothetical protein